MTKCVLGIDLGTSGVKVVAIDHLGKLLAEKTHSFNLMHSFPGYSEQDPEEWVKGTASAIFELISENSICPDEIHGLSFAGQMHGLVLLNKKNVVLRPAILWDDTRTTEQRYEIMDVMGERFVDITHNQPLEGFTLPKILWVQENEPKIWEDSYKFLLPKDYVRFRITGKMMTDFTDATGTAMLNANDQEWSKEICANFSIPGTMCPELVNSAELAGVVTKNFAKLSGLDTSTKVFVGAADNAAGALSAGILNSDFVLSSVGTSGVVLKYENTNKVDYRGILQFENHTIPGTYYSMGVTLSAGYSFDWYKKTFAPDATFEQLIYKATNSPIGANGLIYTPYVMGERAPYNDSSIRGSFIGIDSAQQESDFVRAVLEGITFSFRDVMSIYNNYGNTFDKVVSIGGGSKSPFWLQMQADIYNKEIFTIENEQGPGLGAAMIAAVGLEWYNDFYDCSESFVTFGKTYKPIKRNTDKYEQVYSIYKQVYYKTRDLTKQLLEYRRKYG